MTTRMSEVVPELEPEDLVPYWDGPPQGLKSDGWPECEFEDCTNPTSFQQRDRFGTLHRSCTDHKEDLDLWVRIHNGWEEPAEEEDPAGAGDTDDNGVGEGIREDEAG